MNYFVLVECGNVGNPYNIDNGVCNWDNNNEACWWDGYDCCQEELGMTKNTEGCYGSECNW